MARKPVPQPDPVTPSRARAREAVKMMPALSAQPAAGPGHNSGAGAEDPGAFLAQMLRSLRAVDAGIAELNSRKSALYREAKGRGFDSATIRLIAKEARVDPVLREERQAKFQAYWKAVVAAAPDLMDGSEDAEAQAEEAA